MVAFCTLCRKVDDCAKLLGRRPVCRLVLRNAVGALSKFYNHDFTGDLDWIQVARVPESEVNKRLSGQEMSYSNAKQRIIFSANQVGVNRPVEDRWSAYRFTHCAYPSLLDEPESQGENVSNFDGAAFSVVDGHGGHACAHAINLLHSDYLINGLLPPETCERLLMELRAIDEAHTARVSFDLLEAFWSRPEALLTDESEYIGPPLTNSMSLTPPAPSPRWPQWGPWGPLAASVRDVHHRHLRKLVEETLSCSTDRTEYGFDDDVNGDICDPEGFLVAPLRSIQQAVLANNPQYFFLRAPDFVSPVDQQHSLNDLDPVGAQLSEDISRLHDRVAWMAKTIRDNLRRLDLDLSSAARPSRHRPTLDKPLLRIVFSGCVTTSAFIPSNGTELYVSQIGDCGAVLGSCTSTTIGSSDAVQTMPTEFSLSDWKAELLVAPHTSDNTMDVHRIKSSHPTHEADFIIRDDRLLGELMPLRAFGDIRFKWSLDDLKRVARMLDLPPSYSIMPSFYTTPPYLDSTPQVVWRPLFPQREHFLILATDGLWDMISPDEAVHVVAKHWFDYNCDPSHCGPGDTAATRLIRTALGGGSMDPQRISAHFSLPATIARYYRDDITVIVVYLPTAFPKPA